MSVNPIMPTSVHLIKAVLAGFATMVLLLAIFPGLYESHATRRRARFTMSALHCARGEPLGQEALPEGVHDHHGDADQQRRRGELSLRHDVTGDHRLHPHRKRLVL